MEIGDIYIFYLDEREMFRRSLMRSESIKRFSGLVDLLEERAIIVHGRILSESYGIPSEGLLFDGSFDDSNCYKNFKEFVKRENVNLPYEILEEPFKFIESE
jgi:sensor domain CHASE-containing protein